MILSELDKIFCYSVEHTQKVQKKSSSGGTLLYTIKELPYQKRADLETNLPGKLESVFIELITSKSSNLIISCP